MSHAVTRHVLALTIMASLPLTAVELASPFSDHAVLQRDLPVPVWGTEKPGTTVTVTVADMKTTAVADAQGQWKAVLPRLAAGGPYEMSVAGTTTVVLKDLLVGEVWLCSGQSNMEFSTVRADQGAEEVAKADHPRMRLLNLNRKKVAAEEPVTTFPAKWEACSPKTVGDFSAVGYFFGRELERELQVPIGLISSSWGGTGAESWASTQALEASAEFKAVIPAWQDTLAQYPAKLEEFQKTTLPKWEQDAAAAKAAGKPEPKKPREPRGPKTPQHRPGSLFNGMIAPLVPYALHGVLWYQGEENTSTPARAEAYRRLLPLMVTDWRSRFGSELSFHLVQLANYGKNAVATTPWPVNSWPILRESQVDVATTLPHSGMAVAIDIGNPDDIHPTNKQEVGRRLALSALAKDYGKSVAYSGPVFQGFAAEGATAVVKFTQAEGLAAKGGTLAGFQLAGDDGKFVAATGTVSGATVRLTAPGISTPAAVRYAWANSPEATLVNGAGLPASPFRFPQR